ncbi:hypothetical protein Trydic_g14062 [Trypoxylus dichotomus]
MTEEVISKNENNVNHLDLKLNGNKIKLEIRPHPQHTQGQSRPSSAVPSLTLYSKDDYYMNVKSRRPYSAGNLLYKPVIEENNFEGKVVGSLSLESLDEKDGLSSTQIFEKLISEPIKSYRSNLYQLQNAVLNQQNESSTFEEVMQSNVEKNEERVSICSLMPGLTSKPPLPTKPDNKSKSKGKDNNLLNNDEIELIRLKTLKFEEDATKQYKRSDLNDRMNLKLAELKSEEDLNSFLKYTQCKIEQNIVEELNLSNTEIKEIKLIEETTEHFSDPVTKYQLFSDRQESSNSSEMLTSKSDSEVLSQDNRDINFKNWLSEDKSVEKDISKSEERTDNFLKNLKTQHGEIDKCINKAQKILDKTKRIIVKSSPDLEENAFKVQEHDDIDFRFEQFFQEQSPVKVSKKTLKNNNSKCNTTKLNKNSSIYKKKDKLNSINETKKNRQPCIEKQDNVCKDNTITECQEEESWMSQFIRNDKEECNSKETENSSNFNVNIVAADIRNTKVNQWLQDDHVVKSNGKNTNFLDILENVEDLDAVTRVDDQEILQIASAYNQNKSMVIESNTYDDIVQILKVLEAEDRKSHMKIESIKDMVNQELQLQEVKNTSQNLPEIIVTDSSSRTGSAGSKSSDQGLGSISSLNSCISNYNQILSFLDEVDKKSSHTLTSAKERAQVVAKVVENAIQLDTVPKREDLMSLNAQELCDKIIDLNLRLKDKSSSIKLLQDELSSVRDQVLKLTKQSEDIVKQKLKTQKEEHEKIVKRHQHFIDQLINDKKTLNQQCESLIAEIKVLEDRYNSNMKAMEHKHQVELRKLKEMHVAGEKIRRERWIDSKTQKIKELTVKSLEPELQNMTLRHQQEITNLRALHAKELEDLTLKAARKTEQQCEALREQLIEEREKSLAHERDVIRQRYEKLVENEEKAYQEQKRRLQQEHASRLIECEEKQNAAIVERDNAIKRSHEEFEDKLQAVIRRHNNERKLLKETVAIETETWKNNYRKQQILQAIEKEAKMREQFKKERDKEIEEVIERLEIEANETKIQMEQATENRIRRIKEKFEAEIIDLEQSEKQTQVKYTETKTRLLECEDTVIELRANIKLLEIQLKESKELLDKMMEERIQLKEIVRNEMKQDLSSLEKEVARLREENDKELQQVYSRVKLVVAKKDEVLSELTRDHAALQEKCVYLENMLEQQRKEYLIK